MSTKPLTPEALADPTMASGYKRVSFSRDDTRPKQYFMHIRAPHERAKWVHGPRRATAIQAAQDYCDYVNGAPSATQITLNSADHAPAPRGPQQPIHPKRAEAYRLLREATADEEKTAEGYVYLITDGTAYKIGQSSAHPNTRLKGLQTGNPRSLSLLSFMEVPDRHATETALHAKYIKVQGKCVGEWFMRDPAILAEFPDCALLENPDAVTIGA